MSVPPNNPKTKAVKEAAQNGSAAVEAVVEGAASRVDVAQVSRGFNNTGQAFLGLAVATTAATFAFRKFRQVWDAKNQIG